MVIRGRNGAIPLLGLRTAHIWSVFSQPRSVPYLETRPPYVATGDAISAQRLHNRAWLLAFALLCAAKPAMLGQRPIIVPKELACLSVDDLLDVPVGPSVDYLSDPVPTAPFDEVVVSDRLLHERPLLAWRLGLDGEFRAHCECGGHVVVRFPAERLTSRARLSILDRNAR
jgi:hypothetical protein